MQWVQKDIQQYNEAEQYVDTLLIPLMPFSTEKKADMEKFGFQAELLKIYVNSLEQHFKGRIFLMPLYTYVKNNSPDEEVTRLNHWVAEMKQKPFKHVFFFSFDPFWKKQERKLDGTLLWFPSTQASQLADSQVQAMVKDQLEDIMQLIKSFW